MKEILVIDDDLMILSSIERQLKNEEYSLDLESNPVTGLEKLENKKYDLVLCDLRMKPINGTEVVKKIRENDPEMPIIVLTGYVDDALFDEVKTIGCNEFLIKPVRKSQLIEVIDRQLKKSS